MAQVTEPVILDSTGQQIVTALNNLSNKVKPTADQIKRTSSNNQTVEAALARARSTAAPTNAARFDVQTPCHVDGTCHNCNSPQSICNYVHFLRNSPNGRHVVVLVGESLGY
jgi:hypothetical protein